MTNLASPLPSLPAWVDEHRKQPFPTSELPEVVQYYVRAQAASCGLDEASVAMTALALAAGLAPDNWSMPSGSGTSVGLRFNLVLGVPPSPSAALLLPRVVAHWDERQREALRHAGQLDAAGIRKMRAAPLFTLPAGLQAQVRGSDASRVDLVRRQWMTAICRPAFFLRNPEAGVLKAALASSADNTILAVFDDLITPLLACPPERGYRDLGDLMTHLGRGGQLAVPGKGAQLPLMHPSFSFISTTSHKSFDAALTGTQPSDALVRNSLMIRAESRPVELVYGLEETVKAWHAHLGQFLDARRELSAGPGRSSGAFQEGVAKWHEDLNQLAADDFAPVRPHLSAFLDLPLKLAGLFMCFPMGNALDAEVLVKARAVTEWLLMRMLITAHDARKAEESDSLADAKQRMLGKIIEFGPIDFGKLRRRFKVQDKATHSPVLEALVEEKRVRLDETGKLIAA